MYEQTIVLLGSATDFAVVCQACEARGLGFGENQPALVRGKQTVTVRFQAAPDSRVVPVYGVRVVRAKEAR